MKNLSEFSLRAGEMLGMITNPNTKMDIIKFYGGKPIEDLKFALETLWMISREKDLDKPK